MEILSCFHSDMNSFYASVEMLHHPEFAGMPLAVGGDPEARHGIVLTANYIAKRKGVKTGRVSRLFDMLRQVIVSGSLIRMSCCLSYSVAVDSV